MSNKEVALVFFEIADLLELQGVPFKPRIYRKAAQQIETLDRPIEVLSKEGKLREIPGIGEAIAKKIEELVETGGLGYLEKLRGQIPGGLTKLMQIPTLGPKTVSLLYKKLRIDSIEKLKKACEEHKIAPIKGMGTRTEGNLLRGIELLERSKGRYLLREAYGASLPYLDWMGQCAQAQHASMAGSSRRMKETIGDIDLLVASTDSESVMSHFLRYPQVKEIIAHGKTKSSVRLADDTQVDLRVVDPNCWGSALQYFTGSKAHNIRLRQIAIKKGLKLNEYGVSKKDTGELVASRTEAEVYGALGLPHIPPQLREDWGEIEAAQGGKLPNLVRMEDVRGDFHVHTKASDGNAALEEVVEAARDRGYRFIAITDHSQSLRIAHGLTEGALLKQAKAIRRLNGRLDNFRVFASTECDIKSDGSLDYPQRVLDELDFVVGAIHTHLGMDRNPMTDRILEGISNEKVKILAHPTGRVLGKREAYQLDLDRLFDGALDTDTYMELNAFPDRLDLCDVNLRKAKEEGIKITIGTDAHSLAHLRYMEFGVATAQRGWLEEHDVLNTYPLKEIERILCR